ncbi:hypothetical protein BH09VER1_BH09VER1_18820 [soil metagenome]
MSQYQTEQEGFWAGEFGDSYSARNNSPELLAAYSALWSRILARTQPISSALELGANIGNNMRTLRQLLPRVELNCVEINATAVEKLKRIDGLNVFHGSILDFDVTKVQSCDLAFTAGVLIHISPEKLTEVYDRLYRVSTRYILVVEYYNPKPVEVTYRGHQGRLFKRDFAGELMDRFPDLVLVDYGFQYHRDPNFPADDSNWFLMEKRQK